MADISAAIITFNPNIKILEKNISSVIEQVKELVIVDNGSDNISGIIELTEIFIGLSILPINENIGIAAATNKGIEYLKNQNDWVLVLDQDSFFPVNGIDNYLTTLNTLSNNQIGLLSPVYIERQCINEAEQLTNIETVSMLKIVQFPISSGSLINILAWKLVEGYDENLFIDRVDDDYDLRLRERGFQLIEVGSVRLNHMIGNIIIKKILGVEIKVYNHNAFRKYYQSRNNIIFAKKHGGMLNSCVRNTILILKTIFFEQRKMEKIKSIYEGIKDGIQYNV